MSRSPAVQSPKRPGRGTIATVGDHTVEKFLAEHGHESAVRTLTGWQAAKLAFVLAAVVALFLRDWKVCLAVLNFALCGFYIVVILYKLLTVFLSLVMVREHRVTAEEVSELPDAELPLYTILVPLYREKEVADKVVTAALSFDYPEDKLDVKLLLEEDDPETLQAVKALDLPGCVETIVVPDSQPKTKPKACNHGLERARGELLVIYDAEDRPEPDQLKKAVIAFRRIDAAAQEAKGTSRVVCLQAKLNYYNPRQNWLTKWFALEYSTWFDLFLPGLHDLGVPIPLGGTSNHFRVAELREIGGWDPYNVTEDCDLGMRIHAEGYRAQVLDSTTWEEANSRLWNWIRQRSRWVKGYIQTHFVHTRSDLFAPDGWLSPARLILLVPLVFLLHQAISSLGLLEDVGGDLRSSMEPWATEVVLIALGLVATVFVLNLLWGMRRLGAAGHPSFLCTVGGLSFMLILNPVYWVVGAAYLLWPLWYGERWQLWYDKTTDMQMYPAVNIYGALIRRDWDALAVVDGWSVISQIFWPMAVALLVANFVFILLHVVACFKRGLKDLLPYALLVPVYWVFISLAAWKGLLQLITRPHFWEKTSPGFCVEGTGGARTGQSD